MVVKGVVVDEMGEPIIGANARVKGTSIGSTTDIDGNFSITGVNNGSIIEFSFVGYISQEQVARPEMRIVLAEDNKLLEDVVVVGYGVQKKSVVTASIAKVSSEDLLNKAPVRMDNALKGLAAGVNVTSNSGQPGEASRVRIRGNGTIHNSDPLYIVDGMPIEGGLDFVNPNDIESIEVLKDAASGAIYGTRAANGVILVTTKKGKMGKAVINYNASWGWQSAWKHRDVTNATEYAVLQNEKYINAGQNALYPDPYNLTDAMGNAIPVNGGTDWQELVFNDNAPIVNHDVSISGANDKLNYYLSLGYYSQEGIVGGNYGQSNYDRLTIRSNTNYILLDDTKDRNFLNKLELSVNLSYMRTHATGVATNSEFGSILGSALYMSPILTPTVSGAYADQMVATYADYDLPRDANGNPYTIASYGGSYQEMNNPLALMAATTPSKNWSHKFVPHFKITLNLWDNLKYSFSYNTDLAFWGYDGAVKSLYYLSGNNKQEHTSASQFSAKSTTWQLENVLSYDKTFGKHTMNIVLGQSAFKSKGDEIGGSRWNLVNVNKPSINYATGNYELSTDADGNITGTTVQYSVWGGPYAEHTLSSLFARGSYNYDERYMLQFTIRRDGSSRFGQNNKYGIFPSFSLGWNFAREEYLHMPEWLTIGKLRYSWGKNGNENIDNFTYTTLTSMGNNVLFGKIATKFNGSKANQIANPDLKWEESEQHDWGIDLGFFHDALTFSADYFIKKTNGMITTMPIPSYVGETKPLGNVGDMENKGVEFELGYKGHIADFNYSFKGNVSYLKNKLVKIGNTDGFLMFDSMQGISGGGSRAEDGQPFPFFYGYKTDGVFQNMDEVNAYQNADGTLIQPKAVPGDVRFVDVNGDGTITSDDRTNIGNGNPDWTFGFNFGADWKGFDLNVFLQGVQGADVFDATYRSDVYSGNYPTWMLNRWTGEGTSDKYPRLMLGDETNWQVSDLYICDGSYLRIKNLSVGYTLPRRLTQKVMISRLRIYGMVDNLVTWTKYWGFDPEIASGGTSLGIDRGVYPQARTWTVGFNLSF
jgi:TonB-linked SusC/RagA family outer membrane protein